MKRKILAFAMAVACLSLISNFAEAKSKGKKEMKKAILLVAFGTSDPEAAKSFENIERLAKKRFPGILIKWAYTSSFIRKKLAKQGKIFDSPELALAKLAEEGYTHVAAQSLHTIPGAEYDELKAVVVKTQDSPAMFQKLELGQPLLCNYPTMRKVMEIMLKQVPKDRKKDDAVIFMGHGSEHHSSDLIYVAAAYVLSMMDKNAFLGTVEGHPDFNDVLADCRKNGIRKAYLMPFMSVAGDHAKNDLAGDEDDSWKSLFKKAGIETKCILKGSAEFDEIANIWLDHLQFALEKIDKK
jgi:sirohydrochlorin cobaltochelatase